MRTCDKCGGEKTRRNLRIGTFWRCETCDKHPNRDVQRDYDRRIEKARAFAAVWFDAIEALDMTGLGE